MENKTDILRLRRNLSGCYIFDTLPQDGGKRRPTCIEDCNEATLRSWLWNAVREKAPGFIEDVCCLLNETMAKLIGMFTSEETERFQSYRLYIEKTGYSGPAEQIDEIVRFCRMIKLIACHTGIAAPGSEAAEHEGASTAKCKEHING